MTIMLQLTKKVKKAKIGIKRPHKIGIIPLKEILDTARANSNVVFLSVSLIK